MTTLAITFSNFLLFLAVYNLSKLPWYLGAAPIPSYGLETSIPLHPLIGYRSLKLWSHPVLFLAPHAIMGSSLLIMYAMHLRKKEVADSSYFFALALVFALHVIPERAGIPTRVTGLPLNQIAVGMILSTIALVFAHVLPIHVGMMTVVLVCLTAPILELSKVLSCIFKMIQGTYERTSPDEPADAPMTRNMAGYSGCPFAKAMDVTLQGYPSDKQKE
jgi:hypothetical protein